MTDWHDEISDRIVRFDPQTLARLPVPRDEVVAYFRDAGKHLAAGIAAAIPHTDGQLDDAAVDGILLRAHCELQRLHEEFIHGERVLELLVPTLDALRATGAPPPYRVVDVGCGLGFTVRWLAAFGDLGEDVELIGVDYNRALIRGAIASARADALDCQFLVGNAFAMDVPATVYLSSGVIHHFRGPSLDAFFAEQVATRPAAFLHFDIKPSWLGPIGAWIFHVARMRVRLARHDGVLSTIRAHPGPRLLAAARGAAPHLDVALFDGHVGLVPLLRIFQCVAGFDPALRPAFVEHLGRARRRLGAWA